MKKSKFSFSILLLFLLAFSSCTYRLVDFTIISSKNHSIDIDKTLGKRVKGKSNSFLGIGASIKDAMDQALQSAGPEYDLLIDGVVKINDYILVAGFTVEGLAVSSAKLRASMTDEEYQKWCKENNIFDPSDAKIITE